MPESFYFPVYSGLLTAQHRERIGPAIWEFLWLISKVTKEIEEDGETWGIVLGGKPVKLAEIAAELGGSERTVKRNIARLKDEGYIEAIRAPYGEIYKVRKSKKFARKNRSAKNGTSLDEREDKNVLSHDERRDKNGTSEEREVPHLSKRSAKSGTSNKDIKDIKEIINKEINKEDDEYTVDKILDLLQKSKILEKEDITEFLREDIQDVIDNFGFINPEEMIVEAIKDAARGNGKTWKFVYNKLNAWRKQGIKTIEDLDKGDTHGTVHKHRRGVGRLAKESKSYEQALRELEAARRAWGG
jgi:DnaD/phage-associated family protein